MNIYINLNLKIYKLDSKILLYIMHYYDNSGIFYWNKNKTVLKNLLYLVPIINSNKALSASY